jgi:ketosteroid isomerase-like protein
MTILRHGLTAADRAAMKAFRARLAAHPIGITRASYDAMLEQVPSADSVPDMHREIYTSWTLGDVVFVELALQGTHKGPLKMAEGVIPATGKRMDAPCFDVFRLVNGKIASFHCYPSGTVVLSQLGVFGNLEAAIVRGG